VWWLGWDVLGVAFGTTLAEYVAAVSGIAIALWHLRRIGGRWTLGRILAPARLKRVCFVNGDIMIRSLALMTVFVWFTSQGARQGDAILAGNSILMQFIASCAFFLDGLAFAAEALVGRAVGASQREGLKIAARILGP
jgi:multidrug resistance protein, MATE family